MGKKIYSEEWTIKVANFIIETHCTIEQAAKMFNTSTSTVHKKVHLLEGELGGKVRNVLKENRIKGSLKGGQKTAEMIKNNKYKKINLCKVNELVKLGLTNRQIASQMDVSLKSIERYSPLFRERKKGRESGGYIHGLTDKEVKDIRNKYSAIKGTLELNKNIKVKNSKNKVIRQGKVIAINNSIFTIQSKFRESFNFADLMCGNIKVETVS
jgi:putative DeoR family transcriptional regulator (stage III sporulation protein D)